MNLTLKIIYNSVAQLGGRFFGTALGLVAVAIMTRYLGSSLFGEYTTIITYASIFAIAADLGLTLVASQMINKPGVDEEKTLGNLMAFRSLSGLVIIGLAPLTVWLMPYSQNIKIGVVIATISFWFICLNQVYVSLFQKRLKTDRIAIAETVSRVVLVLLTIYVVWQNLGLLGMVGAMTISNAVYFGLHWVFSRSLIKFGWRFDKKVWWEIFHLSWPMLITIVSNLVYLKADIFILSLLRSPAEVGVYGAAYKVVDILVSLPFMLAGLMLPLLVKYNASKLPAKFASTLQTMFDVTGLASWPLLAGGFVLATPIMLAIAGPEFIISGSILRILLIAIVAVYFSCIFTHAIIGLEKQKSIIVYFLITAVSSIPVYYFLIKAYGVYGAAWGTVYSESLICFFSWWLLKHQAEINFKTLVNWQAILASVVMALILYPLSYLGSSICGLIILILAGVGIYLFIIWKLGALKRFNLANMKYEQKNLDN